MWEAHHDFSLRSFLFINIASTESMSGALVEKNEATPPEAPMISDEWGVIQGISRARGVDAAPGAAAAAKGRSSQPQSISKA